MFAAGNISKTSELQRPAHDIIFGKKDLRKNVTLNRRRALLTMDLNKHKKGVSCISSLDKL